MLLALIAFMYASVGHGGASGYIALMSLFSFAPEFIRPAALMLNIMVSLLAFLQFSRAGHFSWKLFSPFALSSIPASFAGGLLVVDDDIFKRILGVLLLVPVMNLLGMFRFKKDTQTDGMNIPLALFIGVVIGFISGLIGIGGGIFLSPLLLLLGWATMKETAAASALFIFVNSTAGLIAQSSIGIVPGTSAYFMIIFALGGALAGSLSGARKFDNRLLKRVLALVLLTASFKLILI